MDNFTVFDFIKSKNFIIFLWRKQKICIKIIRKPTKKRIYPQTFVHFTKKQKVIHKYTRMDNCIKAEKEQKETENEPFVFGLFRY